MPFNATTFASISGKINMGGGSYHPLCPFAPWFLRPCVGGQVQIATLLIWSVSRYFFALSSHGTLNNQNKSCGTLTKTFWYGKFSCQHLKGFSLLFIKCLYNTNLQVFSWRRLIEVIKA